MRTLLGIVLAVILGVLPFSAEASTEERTLSTERFGTIHFFADSPERAIVLFSGLDGWSDLENRAARALSAKRFLVIGIDSRSYRDTLRASGEACSYIAGEIERLAQSVESTAGLPGYQSPTVAGLKDGAFLAAAAFLQHEASFRGAILFALSPSPALGVRLCNEGALHTRGAPGEGPVREELLPPAKTDRPMTLVSERGSPSEAERIPGAQTVTVGRLEAAFDEKDSSWLSEIVTRLEPTAAASPAPISDLPIVELEPTAPVRDYFAIFFSGDGGWASIDEHVGETLSKKGIPVLGVSSLKYFWKKKEPEALGRDLVRILGYASAKWNRKRFLLVGFSMGAEVLPFAVEELGLHRNDLAGAVLLSPTNSVSFEVHISSWIGVDETSDARPLLPVLERLDGTPMLCLYGEEEAAESACPLAHTKGFTQRMLRGDHHFSGNYETLDAVIGEFLDRLP